MADRGKSWGVDLYHIRRLAIALEALVTDPLARPLVVELRRLLDEAAPGGEVADLTAERARRERER